MHPPPETRGGAPAQGAPQSQNITSAENSGTAGAAQGERDLLDELVAEGPLRRGEAPGQPNHETALRRAQLAADRAQKRRGAKGGGAA
jgi:hypothetical protein